MRFKSISRVGDAPPEGVTGGTDMARFRDGVVGGLRLGNMGFLLSMAEKSKGPDSE